MCVCDTFAQSQPNAFTSIKVNDFHFDPTQSSTCFWYVCRYVPLNKSFVSFVKTAFSLLKCWKSEAYTSFDSLLLFSVQRFPLSLSLFSFPLFVSPFLLSHESDCRATRKQWNANAVAHWQRNMKHKDIGWSKQIAPNALSVLKTIINSKKMCSSFWCSNYLVCFVLFSCECFALIRVCFASGFGKL